MKIVEWIGIGAFIVLCALGILFLRRELIARGRGTIVLSLRLSTMMPGRGWSPTRPTAYASRDRSFFPIRCRNPCAFG